MNEDNISLERLREASADIETIGDQLCSDNYADQTKALALLFIVRDAVIDVLNSLPTESDSIQELLTACDEDIAYFSAMVHNLLAHEDSTAIYEVAGYYTSLVGSLLRYAQLPPAEQLTTDIWVRYFNTSAGDVVVEEYSDDAMAREEILDLQIQLTNLRITLEKGADMSMEERYEVSMEIVCIREILFNIFREVRTYKLRGRLYQRGATMENAFIEDLREMEIIVPTILDEWECSEALQMIDRLIDLSSKIGDFLESSNVSLLRGPFIPIVPSSSGEE